MIEFWEYKTNNEIITKLNSFINKNENKTTKLSTIAVVGDSGTGKSYLVKEIIEDIIKNNKTRFPKSQYIKTKHYLINSLSLTKDNLLETLITKYFKENKSWKAKLNVWEKQLFGKTANLFLALIALLLTSTMILGSHFLNVFPNLKGEMWYKIMFAFVFIILIFLTFTFFIFKYYFSRVADIKYLARLLRNKQRKNIFIFDNLDKLKSDNNLIPRIHSVFREIAIINAGKKIKRYENILIFVINDNVFHDFDFDTYDKYFQKIIVKNNTQYYIKAELQKLERKYTDISIKNNKNPWTSGFLLQNEYIKLVSIKNQNLTKFNMFYTNLKDTLELIYKNNLQVYFLVKDYLGYLYFIIFNPYEFYIMVHTINNIDANDRNGQNLLPDNWDTIIEKYGKQFLDYGNSKKSDLLDLLTLRNWSDLPYFEKEYLDIIVEFYKKPNNWSESFSIDNVFLPIQKKLEEIEKELRNNKYLLQNNDKYLYSIFYFLLVKKLVINFSAKNFAETFSIFIKCSDKGINNFSDMVDSFLDAIIINYYKVNKVIAKESGNLIKTVLCLVRNELNEFYKLIKNDNKDFSLLTNQEFIKNYFQQDKTDSDKDRYRRIYFVLTFWQHLEIFYSHKGNNNDTIYDSDDFKNFFSSESKENINNFFLIEENSDGDKLIKLRSFDTLYSYCKKFLTCK